MSEIELIQKFMTCKRFAFVGVSTNQREFSRSLMAGFRKNGYEPIPVNPRADEINGQVCFKRVQEINPAVEAALIMTSASQALRIIEDCHEAGIKLIWLYRAIGKGAVSKEPIALCQNHNLQVIPGYCPHMFLADTEFFHKIHAFLMKLIGRYPC